MVSLPPSAAILHGLAGVGGEVAEHLLQVKRVGKDLWQAAGRLSCTCTEAGTGKRVSTRWTRSGMLTGWRSGETMRPKSSRSLMIRLAVLTSCSMIGVVFLDLLIRIRLDQFEVIDGAVDDAERVAQFVTHAAGQLPERGQFLLAHQLLLGLPQFARPFGHALLQAGIQLAHGVFGLLAGGNVG